MQNTMEELRNAEMEVFEKMKAITSKEVQKIKSAFTEINVPLKKQGLYFNALANSKKDGGKGGPYVPDLKAVIKDKNYVNGEEERYTCTLQFAFGCKAFTVCGRVGDGLFFVGKREVVGGRECKGGMLFDDCISGVTQREVLSVACLKDNPSALRTAIFRPGEVTDVIMASDGAECALGTTVRKLIGLCEKLRAMAFADRLEALHKRARQGADYNETQNGSGDDSTVVYISLNTTEEKENA